MSTTERPGRVPDWKLERYLLEELPPSETGHIEALERDDAAVRSRLETLRASNGELQARYPAAWMSRQIQRRLDGRGPTEASGWRLWLTPRLAAPAAVVALTVAVLVSLPVEEAPMTRGPAGPVALAPVGSPGLRVKGLEPHLILHRKTATGSERLDDGAGAGSGDRILVQYQAAGAAYGAILSVDGRGAVTRHLPDRGDTAAVLRQDGPVPLEFSYELDDAPRLERFYLVTAAEPFDMALLMRAVEAAVRSGSEPDSLPLPSGLGQFSFTLSKSPDREVE